MPTYEYSCPECGHRFDIWQSVGSAAPECPQCGSATKKVFHASRIIFKGPGFYVTDLASEKSGGKSKDASHAESKSEPKTETKTETKSEPAPASTSASEKK